PSIAAMPRIWASRVLKFCARPVFRRTKSRLWPNPARLFYRPNLAFPHKSVRGYGAAADVLHHFRSLLVSGATSGAEASLLALARQALGLEGIWISISLPTT